VSVTTFVAVFSIAGGAPVLELHNNRSESACMRHAKAMIKNVRLPGNLKLPGITFKCSGREGRS
jgi:hypothetical protein